MTNFIDLDTLHTVVNISILALGAFAILFVLRGIFKVAWRVIRLILILLALLLIVGQLLGFLKITLS